MPRPKFSKFDTHQFISGLKKTGMKEATAEFIVKALDETRDFDMNQMATKMDVMELKLEMAKMATKEQLENMRKEMREGNRWTIGILLTILGIVATAFFKNTIG